jgi:hypothetical protein
MLKQSQSAVLERGFVLDSEHLTEPFEVAWAGEARWFVHFLEPAAGSRVRLCSQISPDGINWIDHESGPSEVDAEGFVSLPVQEFGHWLRLHTTQLAGEKSPLLRIYLVLKA